MIKHIFKIMWNRKKRNFLLMAQIFLAFFVLFGLSTVLIKNYTIYSLPLGYDYRNVWSMYMSWDKTELDTNLERLKRVKEYLRHEQIVETHSLTSPNYPYSGSTWGYGITDSLRGYYHLHGMWVEPEYFEVLKIPVKGRMFDKSASFMSQWIVNEKLAEVLRNGEAEPIVGQELPTFQFPETGKLTTEVIGKIDYFRYRSTFDEGYNVAFAPILVDDPAAKKAMNTSMLQNLMMRVRPTATKADERRIIETLQEMVPEWEFTISRMEEAKAESDRQAFIPMIIFVIVTLFLISNVALGLFGVLWYNISKRKEEIGLRRAMGATASGIQQQFIVEAFTITAFAVITGLFFAVQFPILNIFDMPSDIYWKAIGTALSVTLMITLICALYPSRLAAKKQPAMALHEQ